MWCVARIAETQSHTTKDGFFQNVTPWFGAKHLKIANSRIGFADMGREETTQSNDSNTLNALDCVEDMRGGTDG